MLLSCYRIFWFSNLKVRDLKCFQLNGSAKSAETSENTL